MERYLFRGKRFDNGEFVEGSYLQQYYSTAYNRILDAIVTTAREGQKRIPVDPSTVGQCTGLIDKNGKLIFEGDVVNLGPYMYAVEWSNDGYVLTPLSDKVFCSPSFDNCAGECEVVGTIHDNLDLLVVE